MPQSPMDPSINESHQSAIDSWAKFVIKCKYMFTSFDSICLNFWFKLFPLLIAYSFAKTEGSSHFSYLCQFSCFWHVPPWFKSRSKHIILKCVGIRTGGANNVIMLTWKITNDRGMHVLKYRLITQWIYMCEHIHIRLLRQKYAYMKSLYSTGIHLNR